MIDGDLIFGKRSLVIPENKGISKDKNLATFTSLIALRIKEDYYRSGFLRFKLPAATRTLFTALIP